MCIDRITFIVAMEAEARPLIRKLSLVEDEFFGVGLPMRGWTGEYEGISLCLVTNGKDRATTHDLIGTEAATLSTQLALERYRPQMVINAGTAGGFMQKGARIGDVYLSHREVVYHDHRVDIPGWEAHSEGHYPVWDTGQLQSLHLKYGVVSTGSSLDMPEGDEKRIHRLGGELKEMEAAAVAWVSSLHAVPFFCVKAVTDLVDSGKPTHEEFLQNLKLATDHLSEACLEIIQFFAQNPNIRLK
ncbi:phosphorylase family protein [Thermophagus sp. OGC60D27]|uniref:phosphorylase family protein n=1 Tax=Thermophagus sp. OGC60D27 TaxID=3458415 RepID=UPI004037C217